MPHQADHDVIIIGAGFAGLCCCTASGPSVFPYQPLRTHQLGLTLMLSMNQPFAVRSVAGMLPGIPPTATTTSPSWPPLGSASPAAK
ncbi:hypothetical protein [Nonomuraea basaltis]|uniref:hypothetical protein n=1 Tax=Nonomuraea basaltis TaxID=2495887 RepID=UPI00110C4B36|nr:hypothetical protein [Nonomuraea basaltis]TMR90066.1 hypothetical protein EJK15_57425 [Nonomuraea basaltis]